MCERVYAFETGDEIKNKFSLPVARPRGAVCSVSDSKARVRYPVWPHTFVSPVTGESMCTKYWLTAKVV